MTAAQADPASVVVVGLDGSPGSDRALEQAINEAKWRGAALRVCSFWMYPTTFGAIPFSDFEFPDAAKAIVEEATARATELAPGLVVSTLATEGPPGPELVNAAEEADLLVVGSRGIGEVRGILLGTVSKYCAIHAHCPVLVVRPRRHGSDAQAADDIGA